MTNSEVVYPALNGESVPAGAVPVLPTPMVASFDAFAAMQRHFFQIQEERQVFERFLQFAGLPVRLRIVGNVLARHFLLPFSHLFHQPPVDGKVALTIDISDLSQSAMLSALHVSCQNMAGTFAASDDSRFVAEHDASHLAMLDRHLNSIVALYSTPERLTLADRAQPFEKLIALWYRDHGVQVIHAGLVAKSERGVLFVGRSGSGKSTCSIACLESGFDYVGDDFVGLSQLDDGSFVGHSLYSSALLEPVHFQRFHSLQASAEEDLGLAKRASFISGIFPERMRRHSYISAIVIPHVVKARRTCLSPATRSDALKALAPSSLRLQLSPTSEQFQQLTRLIDRAPAYRLQIGESIADIASCVESLAALSEQR
jgi:hypothetical protein